MKNAIELFNDNRVALDAFLDTWGDEFYTDLMQASADKNDERGLVAIANQILVDLPDTKAILGNEYSVLAEIASQVFDGQDTSTRTPIAA